MKANISNSSLKVSKQYKRVEMAMSMSMKKRINLSRLGEMGR
ncbi:MAG TPA: hypothetical protein PLC17_02425 [Tenuifilaceae bacterium]|nr:hypothetical protein [Tenuifilaceae bacterium]HQB76871.1 hypothetical protein [Tenuifilaceae bacterium]